MFLMKPSRFRTDSWSLAVGDFHQEPPCTESEESTSDDSNEMQMTQTKEPETDTRCTWVVGMKGWDFCRIPKWIQYFLEVEQQTAAENRPKLPQKEAGWYSNHPFLGALAVSFRVRVAG